MKRIVDERPDSPEAAFLRAASGRHVPSRARKRAVATMALAASTLSSSTTAAATGLTAAAWVKGAIGLAVLAIGVSAGVAVHERDTSLAPPPPLVGPAKGKLQAIVRPAPAPKSPASGTVAAEPKLAEAPRVRPTSPVVAPPEAPAPEPSAPALVTTLEAPAPKPSSLPDEVARLEAAKNATNAGRSAEALAALDAYAAAHPRGKLRQEADALRIRALVAAGRRVDAAQRLHLFRAAYPTSPHTAPLEALVGE